MVRYTTATGTTFKNSSRIVIVLVLTLTSVVIIQNIYDVHSYTSYFKAIIHDELLSLGMLMDLSEEQNNNDTSIDSDHIISTGENPYFVTNNYRLERRNQFYSWYEGNETNSLLINADKNGPILDFAIAGLPKTGTTTVSSALSKYAPLNRGDVCTNSAQIVYYSYKNWPSEYGQYKTMRGYKCPCLLESYIQNFGLHLPRTKLIFGIRHPILWFQSFWNQQAVNGLTKKYADNDPYNLVHVCDNPRGCQVGCHKGKLFCVGRARFHLAIAKLGKTQLSTAERKLLAPNDRDGGKNLENWNIQNPLFIYEMNELKEDYMWDGLTKYLGMNETIQPSEYHSSRGYRNEETEHKMNICDEKYDQLRATIMLYSYDLSNWLQKYFVPVAMNKSRTDVHMAQPKLFANLVETYKDDPCARLVRLYNGTFSTLKEPIQKN